jgi:succinate dehydrogenase / fumarate reductase, cytochrome b subunit
MSQAKAGDPAPAPGGSAKPPLAKPPVRPLSPHLQIWRWHVTMLASVLHRATGMALYVGALLITAWIAAGAAGPAAYGQFARLGSSAIGLLVWIGLTLSVFYHLASGVRHLIWDTGVGLNKRTADLLATLCIWFAVIVTAGFWVWLFMSRHVIWNGRVLL